ncbi:uncharacterized protein LOC110460475 [Mizuhopecten yessoensis]|uniref:uncharacterized protein LOC110460475 n=1 Tax=Mizuhopecten yessoensis TaxID=6573 RepID=UPI000B45852E|nr:uncharacterized protein LOC110460475 [Mizuhopecten yessoensis]
MDSEGDSLEVLCGPCQEVRMSIKATLLCVTCKEPFCNNCTKLHRAQSWAQKHSYMSLTDETKESIRSVLSSQVSSVRQKAKDKKKRWNKDEGDKPSYMDDLQHKHDHAQMEMENELFCEQHQTVLCDLCKAKDHKNCVNFTPVADVASSKKSSRDLFDLVAALKKYHRFAEIMYQDRVTETEILEKKREEILQQVMAVRERSDEETNDVDKINLAEFKSMHVRNMKKLSQEKERLTNLKKMTKADAEEMKEMFKDDSEKSPSQFLKAYVRISNKQTVYERFLKEIYDAIQNHDYTLTLPQQDGSNSKSVTPIGEVKQVDTYFRLPPFLVLEINGKFRAKVKAVSKVTGIMAMQKVLKSVPSTSGDSVISERPDSFRSVSLSSSGSSSSNSSLSSGTNGGFGIAEPLRLPSPPPVRAQSVNTFVPYPYDSQKAFFITAIGCLPSGDLAIIDRCASELKVHDRKLRASTSFTFLTLPWDLTILPDLHFAVTLPGEKMVKIVKMITVMKEQKNNKNTKDNGKKQQKMVPTNELVHVKNIPCTGECWGVVYCDKSLFVTCDPWMGNPYILRLCLDDNSRRGVVVPVKGVGFTAPQHITCNSMSTELYVTDSALHCVIALGTDGQLKFIYRARDMGCPTGISVDRSGNIYVCAKETSNVHRVEPGGKEGGPIFAGSDGVIKPRGICYSSNNGNLYIANNNTSKIKAYAV